MTRASQPFGVSKKRVDVVLLTVPLAGIRSRGMTVKGLKDYIIGQGASQMQMQLEWDGIWTVNKKVIDPIAPRYWAIAEHHMCGHFRFFSDG